MSKSQIELDADIAALSLPEALAILKSYGPATRIENPRVRKVVREARSMPSSLGGIKVCLQVAKDEASKRPAAPKKHVCCKCFGMSLMDDDMRHHSYERRTCSHCGNEGECSCPVAARRRMVA